MSYTLWSRGRLLGETELDFVYRQNGFRCGWFHPNALGERLMPVATGVAPALWTVCIIGPDPTARADLRSAIDQEEALELELRGPDGAVIVTRDIGIIDTQRLLSIARSDLRDDDGLDGELEADIETLLEDCDVEEDPDDVEATSETGTEFPRYQIQVQLVDWDSVP